MSSHKSNRFVFFLCKVYVNVTYEVVSKVTKSTWFGWWTNFKLNFSCGLQSVKNCFVNEKWKQWSLAKQVIIQSFFSFYELQILWLWLEKLVKSTPDMSTAIFLYMMSLSLLWFMWKIAGQSFCKMFVILSIWTAVSAYGTSQNIYLHSNIFW